MPLLLHPWGLNLLRRVSNRLTRWRHAAGAINPAPLVRPRPVGCQTEYIVNRLCVLLICIIDFAITSIFADKITGGSLQQHGNEYLMQAGSSLPAVMSGIFMIPFVFLYKPKGPPMIASEPVSMWVRILAFIIDFIMALAIIAPITAIPELVMTTRKAGGLRKAPKRG